MHRHALKRNIPALAVSMLALGVAHAADTGMTLDLHLDKGRVIDMHSLQWGVGVGIAPPIGKVRDVGRPSLSEITWSQSLDTTVPLLMNKALSGEITPLAKAELRRSASASDKAGFLTFETADTVVTGVSMSNDSVSGSIGYSKFTMTYDPQGLGLRGDRETVIYDLAKGKLEDGPAARAPVAFKGTAPASAGIYLRLGSGPSAIAGDSRAAGYENWIEIDSAQMGIGLAYSIGAGGGVIVGKPSISELTITQLFDATVPVVLADLLRGTNIGQAAIEYVTTTAAGPVTFMQLALNEVLFSGLSLSTGGGIPYVSESLNFTSFSQTVWDINADGTRGGFTSVGYDIAQAKAIPGELADVVTGFGAGNLAASPVVAVPEPQTWLMMLAGLGLLVAAARRRSRS